MRIFILLIFMSFATVSAQTLFKKNYIRPGDDVSAGCIATSENGFLWFELVDTNHVLIVLNIDSNGNNIWSKRYRFPYIESVFAIETHDHGFLFGATGLSYSLGWGFGKPAILLIRMNSVGDTLWIRNYNSADNISLSSLIETTDQTFIMKGGGSYQSGFSFDFLVCVDSLGSLLWDVDPHQHYGVILPAIAGGCMLFTNDKSIYINGAGLVIWARQYPSLINYFAVKAAQTSDGGFVIYFLSSWNGMLLKVDSTAVPVWSIKTQHNSIDDLQENQNGEILLGDGHTGWFEKLNTIGDTIYTCQFNPFTFDTRLIFSTDNMPVFYGTQQSSTLGDDDPYIYKTDSIGSNICFAKNLFLPDSALAVPSDFNVIITLLMNGGLVNPYVAIPVMNLTLSAYDGCVIAGAQNISLPSEVRIYPNPTFDKINIESLQEIISVTIKDPAAKSVFYRTQIYSNDFTMMTDFLVPGIYFVYIKTISGNIFSRLIIM